MLNLCCISRPSTLAVKMVQSDDGDVDMFYNNILVAYIDSAHGPNFGTVITCRLTHAEMDQLTKQGVAIDHDYQQIQTCTICV